MCGVLQKNNFFCEIVYNIAFFYTFAAAKERGVAQLASVLAWGARGRKFESSHPDVQKFLIRNSERNVNLSEFLFY